MPLESVEVFEGRAVTLQCQLDNTPHAEVEWLQDGEPLIDSNHAKIERDGNVCSVIIAEPDLDDEGEYTCIARNDFGTDSCSCELLVNESLTEGEWTLALLGQLLKGLSQY